jgi:hypothetical protein
VPEIGLDRGVILNESRKISSFFYRTRSKLRLTLVLALIAALPTTVYFGAHVLAATPGSGTVDPTTTSVIWMGHYYALAAVPDPAAGGAACPAVADPTDSICDHFMLHVGVDPSYWDTHTGGVRIHIQWPSESDDFDLYVYQGVNRVATSGGSTNQEEVFIQMA